MGAGEEPLPCRLAQSRGALGGVFHCGGVSSQTGQSVQPRDPALPLSSHHLQRQIELGTLELTLT